MIRSMLASRVALLRMDGKDVVLHGTGQVHNTQAGSQGCPGGFGLCHGRPSGKSQLTTKCVHTVTVLLIHRHSSFRGE